MAEELSDADLHLYLAGALPPGKRLLLAWALLLDRGLRGRLAALRQEQAGYRNREMASLRGRLGLAGIPSPAPRRAPARAPRGDGSGWLLPRGARPLGYALAGSFAVLALCVAPWLSSPGAPAGAEGWGGGGDVIAKGRGLGVSLYVKGDSAYRVENHAARVSPRDTLQALPLGTAPQHLALLGWDARQGLVRLFPAEGAHSRRVSAAEPPPALLLQDMEDSRLICVTSSQPFRLADAEALLRGQPFHPLERAPAARLDRGLFVQVFAIAKSRGGRI